MKRALENENGDHPTLSRKKRKELKSPSALQPVKEFEYAMLDALLNKDLDKGNAAFDHFRKLGVLPSHNCYSHMLQMLSVASETEEKLPMCLSTLKNLLNEMKEHNFRIEENQCTHAIRILCKSGGLKDAIILFNEAISNGVVPRLRVCAPILHSLCISDDLKESMSFEKRLKDEFKIEITEQEYLSLIRTAARVNSVDEMFNYMRRMAEEIPLPSVESCEALREVFGASKTWKSVNTNVNSEGVCSCCGLSLIANNLKAEEYEYLSREIEALASTTTQKSKDFKIFKKFLADNGPFDVIIDAANVAFYGRRVVFKQSDFFNNVKHVIDSDFIKKGNKKWLAILHKKHEKTDASFVLGLEKEKKLFQVPFGINDDHYWMYATLFGGTGTSLLSNDKMRDHHFSLLTPKSFIKWRDRSQIYYSFNTENWNTSFYTPRFYPVPPFSTTFQETKDSTNWHLPVIKKSSIIGYDGTSEEKEEVSWICCTKQDMSVS